MISSLECISFPLYGLVRGFFLILSIVLLILISGCCEGRFTDADGSESISYYFCGKDGKICHQLSVDIIDVKEAK